MSNSRHEKSTSGSVANARPSPMPEVHEVFALHRATRFAGFHTPSDFMRAQGANRPIVAALGHS
jgi:hypothetical protein